MSYVVQVRFGNEKHQITEFITPNTPDIMQLVNSKPDDQNPIDYFANWVWSNILYPTGADFDRHELTAFSMRGIFSPPAIRLVVQDMWHFPAETLGWESYMGELYGDCEDRSNLLCSLLRHYFDWRDIYVAVGEMSSIPHAWIRLRSGSKWEIIETTTRHKRPLYEGESNCYDMRAFFNDVDAVELETGFFASLHLSANREGLRIKMDAIKSNLCCLGLTT